MTSIADVSVYIQTSSESVPSTPSWFGEVALIIPYLRKQGVLSAINSQVRLARRRFGHYEVIDFLAVLFGYAISDERTLEGFYERLLPLAHPFMALFDRERLPSRSALSRFLASLTWGAVDRAGNERVVFDIDGTREAARQRALPKTEELPAPQRRLNKVCAPGYTGRKRGEVVRTRTVVSQAHSYHWLGNFGNRGNGRYREELRRGLVAIRGYLEAHHLSPISALLRLDGQYGTGAVIADLAGFSFVMRGKDYTVLDRPEVQSRLHLPADQQFSRSESGLVRQLYDCPDVPVGPEGVRCRVVVATHPAAEKKSRIGHTRQGVVYELFFTHLPQDAFTASDVVALYLHRGAFEPVLADEDQEQDPDRWCSYAPAGQEAWQIVSQWVWNLRLELGHVLEPTPMRTTEFAPPVKETTAEQAPVQGYGKQIARLALESGAFLRAGLRPPARRGAALSGWQDVAPNRAAPRSRWQSARALQRQDTRLSRLPFAQAVSVERGSNHEAASDQFTAASSPGWSRALALAGLEPERASARLYAARATPTYRGEPAAPRRSFTTQSGRDPFPSAACPLSPLVGRAARSQRARPNSEPDDDQTVRRPRRLCRLARFGDSLTPP